MVLTSCVTLGKLLSLSDAVFSSVKWEQEYLPWGIGVRNNERVCVKHLAQVRLL